MEYDEMTEEDFECERVRADSELESMKDRIHDLYSENERLKYRLDNHPMNNVYIKKEDVNKWIGKYFEKQDLISIDDLIGVIEDLDSEVERLKEKIEDIEQDIEDNYKPIDKATQYGVSESWFH